MEEPGRRHTSIPRTNRSLSSRWPLSAASSTHIDFRALSPRATRVLDVIVFYGTVWHGPGMAWAVYGTVCAGYGTVHAGYGTVRAGYGRVFLG